VPNDSGLLIVFEGIDNAGKTTQIKVVADRLSSKGRNVHISQEMKTGIGQCFKTEFEAGKLSPKVKALLFAADRYYRIETEIVPLLKQNAVVLADRWVLSSLVYRSIEGQGLELAEYINQDVIQPDITFVLDVDPDSAYYRGQKAKRHSPYSADFLKIARQRYLELAEKQNLIVIDGSQPIEQVTDCIIQHLTFVLEKSK